MTAFVAAVIIKVLATQLDVELCTFNKVMP